VCTNFFLPFLLVRRLSPVLLQYYGHVSEDVFRFKNVIQTHAGQIPLNKLEVAGHTTHVQYPTSKNSSSTSMDGEGHHKLAEFIS